MHRTPANHRAGANFVAADYGPLENWGEYSVPHPRLGNIPGKVFLGQTLNLSGMEVSFGVLPPGGAIPFFHAHKQNEELYLFLSGQGEMKVDEVVMAVSAGSAVRVAPAGLRCWRNTGSEPMAYIVVQAKAGSLEQATGQDGIVPEKPVAW
jgi:mannose-6-phosphate isomerase-like protein (cupin superfamily)